MLFNNFNYSRLFLLGVLVGVSSIWVEAQKIAGMSLSSPQYPILNTEVFESIQNINANWVAFIPEATLDRSTLTLIPDEENHWWGKTVEANIEGIQLAKKAGLKVFLKPHIILSPVSKKNKVVFINNGTTTYEKIKDKTRKAEWRGDFYAPSEMDWQTWEESYEAYILKLAKVAAEWEVDLFSIGTELKMSATKRPKFWRQLIRKIKNIYHGPLIYCANWDEYDKVSFWADLDYIGIDTYFPINKMETPSVKKTLKNWRPIQKKLKKISKKEKKKIILTEFGYRSVAYAGKTPLDAR